MNTAFFDIRINIVTSNSRNSAEMFTWYIILIRTHISPSDTSRGQSKRATVATELLSWYASGIFNRRESHTRVYVYVSRGENDRPITVAGRDDKARIDLRICKPAPHRNAGRPARNPSVCVLSPLVLVA